MSRIATVFGGSGFVGRYVVRRLAKAGWRVRVGVRRPNEAIFVRPYGVPGQVEPVLANIRYAQSVVEAVSNADAVINCVGILGQTRQQTFENVHAASAERVARAAADAGADRLVHISAIGADPGSASEYSRTKAVGERAVSVAFEGAVILRPSIVFGPEDQFFNRFARLTRISPVIPLVGAGTRFQPVYVDDVAKAVVTAIESSSVSGICELGGPEVETFRELMQRMLEIIRRRRLVLDIPPFIARPKAGAFDIAQFLSGGLFTNRILTRDQIKQLETDNVVGAAAQTLNDLGIEPTAMEAVLDSYLYCYRPAGQYTSIHESAEAVQREDEFD